MLTDKFKETLRYEGAVSLTSWGAEAKPHVTGTWITYLHLTEDGRLLAPAAGMHHLESDIKVNDIIYMMLGVREVEGKNGYQGIGFRLTGRAQLLSEGEEYEMMKERYPFLRQVLEITPVELEQLL
ncbi:pyridoxamine 5'-phosphate oxidase family protein [Lactococcus ileimucosae]|uniref:Pyridoxamine 5'-phosphate oxidase family protein n=1 Tax=Lactococcus ileimucosae TaxID=2941329 RepID=A0ABV4D3U6_9LACT